MDTAGSTCSDLNRAAVHEQFNTGDVAAVVRGEEYRRLAEIVRRAEPAERNGGDGQRFFVIRHELGKAGGGRVSGA